MPEHLAEVRDARITIVAKTVAAVKDRLTKEITTGITVPKSSRSRNRLGSPMPGSTPGKPAGVLMRFKQDSISDWRN